MAERLNYQCKFEKYKEELIRLRRHFHRHPELGLQEFETSAFIQEYLGKLGYRFRIVEPTGIIAEHPCQDEAAFAGKKKVVLRAEMDALPIPVSYTHLLFTGQSRRWLTQRLFTVMRQIWGMNF